MSRTATPVAVGQDFLPLELAAVATDATAAAPRVSAARLNRLLGLPVPTAEQVAVIEAPLGPAVVVAGAGSGKTETMAARVVWLVANRLVRPDQVLGLTFTRKAAAELGRRIRRRLAAWRAVVESERPDERQALADLLAGEPTVLTYAAHAGRLVAEHALRIGAEPDARILSPALGWQLADAATRAFDGAMPADIGAPSSVIEYVRTIAGGCADHLLDVDTLERWCSDQLSWFDSLPGGPRARSARPGATARWAAALEHRLALLPLVRDFAAAKAAAAAVDFADQMTLAARLAALPEVAAAERARYAAVLLDEYQDTGHAQVETLRGLFGVGHAVTAVGDPLQSIYGWRGASAGSIARFPTTFRRADGEPAPIYPLATSFRNARSVLTAANTVAGALRSGPASVALRSRPDAPDGRVVIARLLTVEDEAAWVATRMRDAWTARPSGRRTAAVLVRRRSQLPLLADALQAAGLPVEVVGLGGLLTTPEVSDVVATLRVLVDADAGSALARLLTGPRWRIGPADLAALHRRARDLADPPSVVEALDDLGPAESYSSTGFARLSAFGDELRRLRRRLGAPLPDLVADVERTLGVDIEVASRPDRRTTGRAHLDRFLDEAADFAGESDSATVPAFLAFLDAAADEEHGLEPGEVQVEAERIQLLTVHGAKGLEWDVVALPGLVDGIFPAAAKSVNWAYLRQELPAPLRGDRADLPTLRLDGVADRCDVAARLDEHDQAVRARAAQEERRLAYVALTRAREVLFASGYVWDTAVRPRGVSPFLAELRQSTEPAEWAEPEPDGSNPLTAHARTASWPPDPFGPLPGDRRPGRRAAVEEGAALVRAARGDAAAVRFHDSDRARQWAHDVDRLLAERAAAADLAPSAVPLPGHLSVSQLVDLDADPQELARALRRPLPRRPAAEARRGTAFHRWLEQRWHAQPLLDLDELPGAADEGADDADLAGLRSAFESSPWATRTPTEVEVGFEMVLDGVVVRGRMDAVFGSDEEGWTVVDWKTGSLPPAGRTESVAVQLAAYRLAWARLRGIPDDQLAGVRAVFHYVRAGVTVEPTRLLDADGLRRLLREERSR